MDKCYCFDLFYKGYRTRYEYECNRFSQAVDALSFEDPRIQVCSRYIVQRLNRNGEPVAARYNMIRSAGHLNVIPYSKNIYDSTIFVPFSKFLNYLDDEKETLPENLTVAGSWYVNDH